MICEYTGVAETEEYALQVLAGKEAVIAEEGNTAIPSTTVPFVIHVPAGEFQAKTDDYYNYAPVTIL